MWRGGCTVNISTYGKVSSLVLQIILGNESLRKHRSTTFWLSTSPAIQAKAGSDVQNYQQGDHQVSFRAWNMNPATLDAAFDRSAPRGSAVVTSS